MKQINGKQHKWRVCCSVWEFSIKELSVCFCQKKVLDTESGPWNKPLSPVSAAGGQKERYRSHNIQDFSQSRSENYVEYWKTPQKTPASAHFFRSAPTGFGFLSLNSTNILSHFLQFLCTDKQRQTKQRICPLKQTLLWRRITVSTPRVQLGDKMKRHCRLSTQ